ncbi:MAG: prephenate dehydrogenase [bacterium]|nr:prephenate dehydrogenase [bacterium]
MNIGIIGAGRFGKLLAEQLENDNKIFLFDKLDDKDELESCNLVIYAVPNSLLQDVINETKEFIQSDAIVMDVGSVKIKPCAVLQEAFGENILGTHPLFGPDSASDSWEGHKMVFCKLNIPDDQYNKVKELFISRGVKAIECSPEEHDKMMAKTQALVHYIGRALSGIKEQEISTPDYANLLRMMEKVTHDTWELFYDMQNLNPYAKLEREKFSKNIAELEEKINQELDK